MTKPSKPWGYVAPSASKSKRTLRAQTLAVRGELTRTGFGETSEALFLNSGFTYPTAEAAEGAFAQTEEHQVYSRSLSTHPATTTHYRLDAATRTKLGISDSTLRLSVGLEDPEDLLEDLLIALKG
jgi:cystathionine beta-lyase/cystathionine gamma-synthase